MGGNVAEGWDLIGAGTSSQEDASGRIMELLQGEETETLHEGPLHLRDQRLLEGFRQKLSHCHFLSYDGAHLSDVDRWVQAVADVHDNGGAQVLQQHITQSYSQLIIS